MMKKSRSLSIPALLTDAGLCLFAYGLLRHGQQVSENLRQSLALCAQVLLPSLFPFFVLSGLLVRTGAAAKGGRLLEKPIRLLFRLPGACAPAFALGMVGGYPVGIKTACALYEQKLCSRGEALRLTAFCNNCGPAFILGVAGAAVFRSLPAGLLLWGCHVLASLCTGLLFRFYGPSSPRTSAPVSVDRPIPFSHALVESITSAAASLIHVCAFVLFFGLCIGLMEQMGISSLLLSLLESLGIPTDLAAPLLSGCMEMSAGIWGLSEAAGPLPLRLSAAAFLLAFGGLSVHFQSLSFLTESGLSAAPYLLGKLVHGVLAALLTYAAACYFPTPIPASGDLFSAQLPYFPAPPLLFLFSLLLCLFFLLFPRLARRK